MVEVVYLSAGEQMPKGASNEAWLLLEASGDGRFFGTGWGRKPSGEGVGYISLPEADRSLEAAVAAAIEWAAERGVSRIFVQPTPE